MDNRLLEKRHLFHLKPDEAQAQGRPCYLCNRLSDCYYEASRNDKQGQLTEWKYTMFLCTTCLRTHELDISSMADLELDVGSPPASGPSPTPDMMYPLWST